MVLGGQNDLLEWGTVQRIVCCERNREGPQPGHMNSPGAFWLLSVLVPSEETSGHGRVSAPDFVSTTDVLISAFFWVMKEDSWCVSQMRVCHALASHGSVRLSTAVMRVRRRVLRYLYERFTQSHKCNKIKGVIPTAGFVALVYEAVWCLLFSAHHWLLVTVISPGESLCENCTCDQKWSCRKTYNLLSCTEMQNKLSFFPVTSDVLGLTLFKCNFKELWRENAAPKHKDKFRLQL